MVKQWGSLTACMAVPNARRWRLLFRRTGGERWVSIIVVGASIHGYVKRPSRGGWQDLGAVGHGELEVTAMAATAGAAAHSHVTVAVAVKWMVDLDSRTYGKDQMREREWRCTGCG